MKREFIMLLILLFILGLLPANYANAASITSVSPQFVEPGDIITITGKGFGSSYLSSVFLDSIYISKLSWSDTEIKARIPWYFSLKQRLYLSIWNTNEYSSEEIEGPYIFPKPSITLVTPSQGKIGDLVKIYGKNFGNERSEVKFGDTKATIINWENDLIELKVPFPNYYSGHLSVMIQRAVDDYYSVEADFELLQIITNDDYSHYQTYLSQAKVVDAWKEEKVQGRLSVIVAVIDSGVYENHPDLIDAMWRNNNEVNGDNIDNDNNGYIDDYYGWNFIDNNADMTTKDDHGTKVAGIIGAKKDNNWGIAGIASGVEIMPVIVCDSNGCPREAVSKAIKYATDMGADIINLSLGGSGTMAFEMYYNDAISYAFSRGVLIVAAAGNDDYEGKLGQNLDYIKSSPICNDGNYNMVLGVAAVDKDNKRPSWSSFGYRYVDIYAPGENIYSTSLRGYSDYDLSYGTGTSFSAPIVSGVAALIKSKYPTITNTAIRDRIINTSNDGLVDALKAIKQKLSEDEKKSNNIIEPTPINEISSSDIGKLVKTADNSAVYYVKNGIKHVFPHQAIYRSWGFPSNYSTVKTIPILTLNSYNQGTPVPFRSGYMFRGTSTSLYGKQATAVFIADGQQIRPIYSGELYQELFNDPNWRLVVWVPDDLLSKFDYELGEDIVKSNSHPDGTLIRYIESPDKIYLIEDGKKRLITNAGFTDNAFDKSQVINISSSKYYYPDGKIIEAREEALSEPF